MRGYLKSKDIKRLLCLEQYDLNNLVNKRKLLSPLQLTKNLNPQRANRHYTLEDLRTIGKIFYGGMYTKIFILKCPFCNKPMQTSLSDIIIKQLENRSIK